MKRKIFAAFLSLCMVISLVPMTALAAEESWTEVSTAERLSSALVAGGNIKLTENITVTEAQAWTVEDGVNVVLDLNGHTISSSYGAINYYLITINGGSLTIKDNSESKSGKIEATDSSGGYGIQLKGNGSSFTLMGGTIQTTQETLDIYTPASGSIVNISGGKLVSTSDSVFNVRGSNTVVNITGGDLESEGRTGVYISNYGDPDSIVFNMTGGKLTHTNGRSGAIQLYKGATLTIGGTAEITSASSYAVQVQENTILNVQGGTVSSESNCAISVSDESAVNVSGGEISTGKASNASGAIKAEDNAKVVITGGSISAAGNAIYADDSSQMNISGESTAISAGENYQSVKKSGEDAKISITGGRFTVGEIADNSVSSYIPSGMEQASDGSVVIDTDTAVAEVNGVGYTTLQDAIDKANANDIVYVYAGEHDGSILINKNLTLVGPTDGEAIITISDTTASAIQELTAINGETNPYSGIVAVANADATLQNITIRGDAAVASDVQDLTHNTRYAGLVALNASVTMENCNIEDITYEDDLQGMQNGFGIYAVAQNNETLTLTNVDITNFNKAAAVIRSNVDLVMTGGSVVGFGEQGVISQNGIQYAGNATISGTTFSDLQYVADNEWSGGSTAIYNVGNGTVSTIENVTTTDVDYSVSADAPTTISGGNYDGYVYGYNDNLTIRGGTFASSVAQYVAEDLKYEAYRDNIGYTYHETLEAALATGGVVSSIEAAENPDSAVTVTFVNGGVMLYSYDVTGGEEITLPALPNQGYNHFVGWSDGTTTYDANTQVKIEKDTTFTAVWSYTPPANPNYKITIDDAANGTVTANPTAAKAGATVTLTATPDEGYAVGTVTVTDRFGNAVRVTENSDGTYTFTMPNGQVTVTATFVQVEEPAPTEPFIDVAEGDWFYDAVVYAYQNELMDGVGGNRFAPNSETTRAQLVTILYRLEGEPAVSGDLPFTDVEAGIWYTDAILWAAQNNIVNGVSDTEFAPGDEITRQQLVTILYRYAEAKGYDVSASADLSGYPDAGQVQDYAQPAMAWAVAENIIQGMEDGTLKPAGNASRAQIATILMRFCEDVAQ